MIKIKGRIATFTGKDLRILRDGAKASGLSVQNFFTGLMWEMVMREARKGIFLTKKVFK